jgi:hypothetical protein
MKLLAVTFFGAVALFGIGACERHSFEETRKLHDAHDSDPAHPAPAHGTHAAPAEGGHAAPAGH